MTVEESKIRSPVQKGSDRTFQSQQVSSQVIGERRKPHSLNFRARLSKARPSRTLRRSAEDHQVQSRFCSRDPIGYVGSPWNVYEYVASMPLVKQDPTGLVVDCQKNFETCVQAARDGMQKCQGDGGGKKCWAEFSARYIICLGGRAKCIIKQVKPRFRLPCLPVIILPIDVVVGGDPNVA
jgi:hypothetical protein